jgi:hypothetical protein
MAASVFDDKSKMPDAKSLGRVLQDTKPVWQEILAHLDQEYGDIHKEWKHYSKKSGWVLKVIQKKRTVFYLIPHEGCFDLSFIFGDKAVAAAEKSTLPKKMLEKLRAAKKYVEGRALSVPVKSPRTLKSIKTLVAIKLAN